MCKRPSGGPALRLLRRPGGSKHTVTSVILQKGIVQCRHCVRSDRVSHCVVTAQAWVRNPRGISMQSSVPRFTAHSSFFCSVLSYEFQPPQQPSLPPLLTETVHLMCTPSFKGWFCAAGCPAPKTVGVSILSLLRIVQDVREDKPNMGSSRNSYYFFKLYKWIFQCERISVHRPGLQSHMRTFY